MEINLIRFSNSLDPNDSYKKDSDQFLEDINNDLFDDDLEIVENADEYAWSMIFIETGGSEQKFILEEEKFEHPFVLLTHCKNNSLPACFEIKTYIDQKYNEECLILFGTEPNVANTIKHFNKIMTAKKEISSSKLGVIGKPSDWLIASTVNYEEVKKKFGTTLIDIPSSELKEEIDKGLLDDLPHYQKMMTSGFNKDVIEGAYKIYSGLKRIIDKYQLNGFTLRCFDLIEEYKNTACLALAMLNEQGILAGCEGDVPSLLTMLFVKAVSNQPSFQANPSRISFKDSKILFAHCTVPLNMCKKYELMTHFESGLGIGIRGTLDTSHVTICKIAPNLKNFLCVSGEIKENQNFPNYCRTQVLVELESDGLFDFIKDSYGNHVIITYNDIYDDMMTLFHIFPKNNKDNEG